jgi:hypothetical protein
LMDAALRLGCELRLTTARPQVLLLRKWLRAGVLTAETSKESKATKKNGN